MYSNGRHIIPSCQIIPAMATFGASLLDFIFVVFSPRKHVGTNEKHLKQVLLVNTKTGFHWETRKLSYFSLCLPVWCLFSYAQMSVLVLEFFILPIWLADSTKLGHINVGPKSGTFCHSNIYSHITSQLPHLKHKKGKWGEVHYGNRANYLELILHLCKIVRHLNPGMSPDKPCFWKQCRSRSVGFFSQLTWICTVCH